MLLAHPWAVELWTRVVPGPSRFAHMERLLRLLDQGGLTGQLGDLGLHAVTLHVAGFTQQQLGDRAADTTSPDLRARVEEELTPDRYPLMVAHIRYHDDADNRHPDEFGFVLDLILDGLERARAAR